MTATTYPFPAVINSESQESDPLIEVMSNVGNLYSQSMQSSIYELWMSSAKIVQDQTFWASHAVQDCMAALVQNAYDVQQRALARLGTANQKAVEMMSSSFKVAAPATPQVTPQLT